MKKITFRSIYDVRWRKFNVTSEGVKVERDVNGNEFITGSADNVKHCIVEIMCQNDGYIRPKKIFEKTFDKNVRKKGVKKCEEVWCWLRQRMENMPLCGTHHLFPIHDYFLPPLYVSGRQWFAFCPHFWYAEYYRGRRGIFYG